MADAEIDLLRSSLDLLVLKALSWGPMHGYGISEWIESATASLLLVEEGTLYPALHRLERRGWIASDWGVSDNNRRAKFYKLTAAGRRCHRGRAQACRTGDRVTIRPGWRRAFRLALGRRSVERDVDDELAFHLVMREEKLRGLGVPADVAPAQARERFGDPDRVRDECITIDEQHAREVRLMEWLE